MMWWFFWRAGEEHGANVSYTAARGEYRQPRPDEPLLASGNEKRRLAMLNEGAVDA